MLTFSGITPVSELKRVLNAWMAIAFPASPNRAEMHLFKNNFTVSSTAVLADFTEADFDGYALGTMGDITDFAPAKVDGDGNVSRVMNLLINFAGDPTQTTPNTIYGWYLTSVSSGILLQAGNFVTPLDFTVPNAQLDMEYAARIISGGVEGGIDAEYGIAVP